LKPQKEAWLNGEPTIDDVLSDPIVQSVGMSDFSATRSEPRVPSGSYRQAVAKYNDAASLHYLPRLMVGQRPRRDDRDNVARCGLFDLVRATPLYPLNQ